MLQHQESHTLAPTTFDGSTLPRINFVSTSMDGKPHVY